MGGGFLNITVSAFELGPAKDIAAPHDQPNLAADFLGLLHLLGDLQHFFHADPPLAGVGQAFTRELEDDALERRAGEFGSRHEKFLLFRESLAPASTRGIRRVDAAAKHPIPSPIPSAQTA